MKAQGHQGVQNPFLPYALELTDTDFRRFSKLVYEASGINIHQGKKELLRARLAKRVRELGLGSFRQYYNYVLSDETGEEIVKMVDYVTTNLTRFFREEGHFVFLSKEFYPRFLTEIREGRRPPTLWMWSAACATGEEPYSLVIHAKDSLRDFPEIQLKVLATDISTRALEKAKKGIYPIERIADMPRHLVSRFFLLGHGPRKGQVRVSPGVRSSVYFQRHNLLDPPPVAEEMDIVFCRNVLIYFEKDTQRQVVQNILEALKPGGYLFLGHAESLNGMSCGLKYIKPSIYRKL